MVKILEESTIWPHESTNVVLFTVMKSEMRSALCPAWGKPSGGWAIILAAMNPCVWLLCWMYDILGKNLLQTVGHQAPWSSCPLFVLVSLLTMWPDAVKTQHWHCTASLQELHFSFWHRNCAPYVPPTWWKKSPGQCVATFTKKIKINPDNCFTSFCLQWLELVEILKPSIFFCTANWVSGKDFSDVVQYPQASGYVSRAWRFTQAAAVVPLSCTFCFTFPSVEM